MPCIFHVCLFWGVAGIDLLWLVLVVVVFSGKIVMDCLACCWGVG